jgi:hypothetical protein
MHPQIIAFFDTFEAFPAEVSPSENKRRVRLFAGEVPIIHKRISNGNDQLSRRTYYTPKFFQYRWNVIDFHQDVVSHNEIKLSILAMEAQSLMPPCNSERIGLRWQP